MLIVILLVVIIIVGIVFLVKDSWYKGAMYSSGFIMVVLGGLLLLIALTFILETQIPSQINYEKTLHRKEVLEYRLENIENDTVGNEYLYGDIVEFNNEVRAVKYWSKNLFTNWFYNKKIASIDYIEFKE